LTLAFGFLDVDAALFQPVEVLGTTPAIDEVECLVADMKPLPDEGRQDLEPLVTVVKQRTDVARLAEGHTREPNLPPIRGLLHVGALGTPETSLWISLIPSGRHVQRVDPCPRTNVREGSLRERRGTQRSDGRERSSP
jgi:hypothetical protein